MIASVSQSVSQSVSREREVSRVGLGLIGLFITLRSVTRSAAWRSVRADMSSTSLCRVGLAEAEGDVAGSGAVVWDDASGGGGGDDDDDDEDDAAEVVVVASARARTNGKVLLCACVDGRENFRASD